MASPLSALRRAAVPLAGASTAALLLASPVHAQEEAPAKKPPMYDAPAPAPAPALSAPTHPTPTDRLAAHIGAARRFINAHYRLGTAAFDDAFSRYLAVETSVTRTIADLAPGKDSGEQVVPGAIYTAVATMAGAIAARNRALPVRALTPLAVGVAAGWYFVPETMTNVGELAWYYEKKVPGVAEAHLQTRQAVVDTVRASRQAAETARRTVDENVSRGRKMLEDLVRKG